MVRANLNLFIITTDENEVKLIVRELSPNKSAGHNDILPNVVKAVINSIAPQFVDIFNKSLPCRIFRNELKVAKVYPVNKYDDKLTISYYRHISALHEFSKILEKYIIFKRISDFANKKCAI